MRFTVRRTMIMVAVVALLLTIIIPVGRLSHYARVQRQMQDWLYTLQYRVPPGISPATWDCAWGWTLTAYGNVCFSEEHVPINELYRLREDFASKLQGPIDAATLVWFWDRLSRTGPHGKRYVTRHKPAFMDCFPPGTRFSSDDSGPP
jgi:hypothetical protein